MRLFYYVIYIFLFATVTNAADLQAISQEISDSVITTKITAKYTKDTELNPLNIKVSTKKGIVNLQGNVNNNQAFITALRLANNTKGVKGVNTDNLDIKKINSSLKDAYITAKIEAAILTAKVLDDETIPLVGINASTINGIVTLTGYINNAKSINVILKRAYNVPGVKKVISQISTKNP